MFHHLKWTAVVGLNGTYQYVFAEEMHDLIPVWLQHHYSQFVMGRTATWYRSQGTALEPSHKKHTSYKSMLMRFHVHETDRINSACVFVGAHVHIKRNKLEEAKTINQYQHFMV